MKDERLAELNLGHPQARFDGKVQIVQGSQKWRSSTGIELQVMLPVVNAPFRIYWAYNPMLFRRIVQSPIVVDRSAFPNNPTFVNAVGAVGQRVEWYERRSTFRFTIGRTF